MQGQDPQALDLGPGNGVVVGSHQFVAPADGQHGVAGLDVVVQGFLEALQVLGHDALFIVLAAAEEDKVVVGRVELAAQGDIVDLGLPAFFLQKVAEDLDVTGVPVGVHQVFVEVGNANQIIIHSQNLPYHNQLH